MQSLLTYRSKCSHKMKRGSSFYTVDEEEGYMGQIEDLKGSSAKKDAEISQLRSDLAQVKETTQGSKVGSILSNYLNEHGTEYVCLKSIGVKSESYHMKEYPRIRARLEKREVNSGSLRACPRKNRPLEFRPNTEFL